MPGPVDFARGACQSARHATDVRTNGPVSGSKSGRSDMTTTRRYLLGTAAALAMVTLAWAPGAARAQTAVAIDGDDIGGVVRGPNGPEAGVWVIAETTDLPTRFARMV